MIPVLENVRHFGEARWNLLTIWEKLHLFEGGKVEISKIGQLYVEERLQVWLHLLEFILNKLCEIKVTYSDCVNSRLIP